MSNLLRLSAVALVFAGVIAGCASGNSGPIPVGRERGYQIAQRQCTPCHSAEDERGPVGAPSFLRLGRRYNALTFGRKMQEIAAGRHGLMPALQLTPDEASDLAAYIAALGSRPAPCNSSQEASACPP